MAGLRTALLLSSLLAPVFSGCLALPQNQGPQEPLESPPASSPPPPPVESLEPPRESEQAPPPQPPAGGFSATDVFPGSYDGRGNFSRVLRQGPHALREPEVVRLTSDVDGADIELGLVRPEVPPGTRVPVLLVASPYFVPMTPKRITGEERVDGALPHLWAHYEQLVPNFVPHGYAVALLSTRGSGNSGGCMDLLGPLEQADLDQAVTWLGTQEWSSGAVGMIGLSYSASTPWEVAAKGNPHLHTIVAAAGLPSLGHYLFYNGTVHGGAHGAFPGTYYPFGVAGADSGRSAGNTAAGAACPALPASLAAPSLTSVTLEDESGFFAEREHRPAVLQNWRGSVFLLQGLEDWRVAPKNAFPWAFALAEQGVTMKHWLGQGGHAFPDTRGAGEHRRMDFAENLLHWFEFWLKGDATQDLGPRWQVEDSHGRWRSEEAWPPADAVPLVLRVGADGDLTTGEPTTGEAVLAPEVDRARGFLPLNPALMAPLQPLPGAPCGTCARFASAPFEEGLQFAGLPTLHLPVTPTGPGGQVTARLFAAHPEGERLLGRGGIDLRLAGGGDGPREVVPGQQLVARLTFEPLDAVVHEGETLVLVLDQGGYEERMYSLPTYPVKVHLGPDSVLTLSTFVRGEDAFFEPPRAEA